MLIQFIMTITQRLVRQNGMLYALRATTTGSTHSLPRQVMRRIRPANSNTTISVDPDSLQASYSTTYQEVNEARFLVSGQRVWFVDGNSLVSYSDDQGQSWRAISVLNTPRLTGVLQHTILIPASHASRSQNQFYYIHSSNELYWVEWPNGSPVSWAITSFPQTDPVRGIGMTPGDTAFFAFGSRNAGGGFVDRLGQPAPVVATPAGSYVRQTFASPLYPRGILFTTSSYGFLYGYKMIAATSNAGVSWTTTTLPDYVLRTADQNSSVVLIGGYDSNAIDVPVLYRITNINTATPTITLLARPSQIMYGIWRIRFLENSTWLMFCVKGADTDVWRSNNNGLTWALYATNVTEKVFDGLRLSMIGGEPEYIVAVPEIRKQTETSTTWTVGFWVKAQRFDEPYTLVTGEQLTVKSQYALGSGGWVNLPDLTFQVGNTDGANVNYQFNRTTANQTLRMRVTEVVPANSTTLAEPSLDEATHTIQVQGANYPYAGEVSANYSNDADACSYGNSTVPVYTTDGTFEIGLAIYYNASGTNLLTNGYYLTDFGEWIRVANDQILEKGLCGMPGGGGTPPPGDGGGPIMA